MSKWLIFLFIFFIIFLFSYKYLEINKKTSIKTDKIVQKIQYKEDKIKKYEEDYFEKRKKAINLIKENKKSINLEIENLDKSLEKYFDSEKESLEKLLKLINELNFKKYENKDIIKLRDLLKKYTKKSKFKKSNFLLKEKLDEMDMFLNQKDVKGVE